jgi:hypothetical protein
MEQNWWMIEGVKYVHILLLIIPLTNLVFLFSAFLPRVSDWPHGEETKKWWCQGGLFSLSVVLI